MRSLGGILIALAIAGCAAPTLQSGAAVETPVWMIDFCHRHPSKPECN